MTLSRPSRMVIRVGGFGRSVTVTYDGQVVRCRQPADGGSTRRRMTGVSPSEAEWGRFLRDLDALGMWNWQKWYPFPGGVCDGTEWEVRIGWGGLRFRSTGDNNFPGRDGSPTGTPMCSPVFERFLKAVNRLVRQGLF